MRIGPVLDTKTTHLAGVHSVENLMPSKPYFPKLFLGAHRHSFKPIRLSILDSKQFVAEEAERIHPLRGRFSQPGDSLREQRTNGPNSRVKRRTVRGNPARKQPKYNHHH